MQIYNTKYLDSNTKFILAILAGLATAIVGGVLYGLLSSILHVEVSVVFVFTGWCVGYVIRTVGRGVHLRFSIVGAIMTLLAIFIGDCIAMVGIGNILYYFTHGAEFGLLMRAWLSSILSTDISSLLRLLFRAAGVYFGYQYSRVL